MKKQPAGPFVGISTVVLCVDLWMCPYTSDQWVLTSSNADVSTHYSPIYWQSVGPPHKATVLLPMKSPASTDSCMAFKGKSICITMITELR